MWGSQKAPCPRADLERDQVYKAQSVKQAQAGCSGEAGGAGRGVANTPGFALD